MQQIIRSLQLFQLYMCHSNTLYVKLSSATETLQPRQTPKALDRRAVPSEMIACGCKNGDPTAMTTAESGSVCRFCTQNGILGMFPALTRAVSQTTSTSETSKPSSDTTAATETGTTSSGSATEATAEISDDNRSESRSDTGAIDGGVVGALAVLCGTAVAVIYLFRKSHTQRLETTLETGQGMTEAPGHAETDNGPKQLVGSKPSDVPANR
ncbi:hypothetical protein FMEXI_9677 [Fusarium mexicanum]|uniref:Uncharacterized protein n=1 Tax=Fusarium mexicanum TaxID=751941 RepID=A0A8H5IIH0_9HYPO|nr:hypothetical protein FMEXI_9677 [Fusarium mexicanum]